MTQEEKRIWLIRRLLSEESEYREYGIPTDTQGQRNLLRALMNVRPPRPLSPEFMRIQDDYLREENRLAGVTEIGDLTPCPLDNRIYLWQGDITTLKADAIVNAANSALLGCFRPLHNCIDNIIHSKAGLALREKCNCIMAAQGHEEPTGQAKITPGYNLPCKYVIHTVGPIVEGQLTKRHEALLASCYQSCLKTAEENGCQSIAFCCISTGVFMFPNQRAAEIAVDTVRNYYEETGSQIKTIFNVFKDVDGGIYRQLLQHSS